MLSNWDNAGGMETLAVPRLNEQFWRTINQSLLSLADFEEKIIK